MILHVVLSKWPVWKAFLKVSVNLYFPSTDSLWTVVSGLFDAHMGRNKSKVNVHILLSVSIQHDSLTIFTNERNGKMNGKQTSFHQRRKYATWSDVWIERTYESFYNWEIGKKKRQMENWENQKSSENRSIYERKSI